MDFYSKLNLSYSVQMQTMLLLYHTVENIEEIVIRPLEMITIDEQNLIYHLTLFNVKRFKKKEHSDVNKILLLKKNNRPLQNIGRRGSD